MSIHICARVRRNNTFNTRFLNAVKGGVVHQSVFRCHGVLVCYIGYIYIYMSHETFCA